MKRILVPLKDTEDPTPATTEAIRQARLAGRAEIHPLNVQPRMLPGETLALAPKGSVEMLYYERSRSALGPAEKLLSETGIAFTSHRSVGNVAECIVEKQRELECDSIVMNSSNQARIRDLRCRSISAEVLKLAQVPITLVKQKTRSDSRGRYRTT